MDVLVGSAGPDVLAGGADADEFLFDGMALANFHLSQPLPPDHVVDYNRSSGVYDPAEGDKIGLYPILSAAYGSGDPIGSLVYAVQNGSGADLRIDIDGTYNGNQWITIARLDGLQANQAVTVVLNQNQPLGATIFVASAVNGTSGDDTFSASGSQRINAGAGSDTIGFGFALTEATVSWSGTEIYVDGPGGVHAALAGFEIFSFTDGTVDTRDGNALVDDLFYYARNHDVWNAHADAEQHYDSFGWREGRDPNAWFSTTFYLALNQDVKAAGANPLAHYHQAGWMEARVPSADFDAGKYLQANPDVAAGHVDPLEHFLAFGRAEGRQPFSLPGLVSGDAFDAVYYLAHNPDVRAAEVDPHQHYHQFGWREGRDPNALFSTNGYLAHYADVAAAGIDPLEHYNTFGWHEGRDPSPAFDTTEYLAHYPDVAAAGVNPLAHYLMFGYDERRSSFADGVWG
jgi:serralysin